MGQLFAFASIFVCSRGTTVRYVHRRGQQYLYLYIRLLRIQPLHCGHYSAKALQEDKEDALGGNYVLFRKDADHLVVRWRPRLLFS
jgi:hypothetical protein